MAALNYVTIEQDFSDVSDAPVTGTVTFTANQTVYAAGAPLVLADVPIQGQIVGGQLQALGGPLQLLATDNTGLTFTTRTGFPHVLRGDHDHRRDRHINGRLGFLPAVKPCDGQPVLAGGQPGTVTGRQAAPDCPRIWHARAGFQPSHPGSRRGLPACPMEAECPTLA